MARILGCDPWAICYWRNSRGLKTNFARSVGMDAGQHASRMVLYNQGYTDSRIARTQHVREQAVFRWRQRRGLPAHGGPRVRRDRRDEAVDPIFERIKRAVGRKLSADIVDDAVGQLYIDVVSGKTRIEDIEKVARSYSNGVLNSFASKYGPRSIDETIAGTEDLRLIDTLVDESSSSWLEEMGATVW